MSMSMTFFYSYRIEGHTSENSIFSYCERTLLLKNSKKMSGVVGSKIGNQILAHHTRRSHEQ